MINEFSFLNQFFLSNAHHFSLIVINRDIFLYLVLIVVYCDWERVYKAFFNAIVSFTLHSHRYPILSTQIPISHVSNGCISSTSSTTFSSCSDDLCTSLLYSGNEFFIEPIFINSFINPFSIDFGMNNIWEHSRRMISPNAEITNIINMAIQFQSQLSKRPIVV